MIFLKILFGLFVLLWVAAALGFSSVLFCELRERLRLDTLWADLDRKQREWEKEHNAKSKT
jgi:hypothetical protein